jgi:hypothetical protein
MHFISNIKEGKSRSYQLSIWLGSTKPAEEINNKCTLEWEKEPVNGGFIKMAFKLMQCLQTARNLILAGVPTDVDATALQAVLAKKMEESRQKW